MTYNTRRTTLTATLPCRHHAHWAHGSCEIKWPMSVIDESPFPRLSDSSILSLRESTSSSRMKSGCICFNTCACSSPVPVVAEPSSNAFSCGDDLGVSVSRLLSMTVLAMLRWCAKRNALLLVILLLSFCPIDNNYGILIDRDGKWIELSRSSSVSTKTLLVHWLWLWQILRTGIT